MKLNAYLERIGYSGDLRPDLATLNGLMDAHIRAVPFENTDIYAVRPVRYGIDAAFEQIVTHRQGGWCYEMNGVFGWALSEIGFEVTRLAAGVRRAMLGDGALGNHLCLMVTLDQPYLVDVGFGSTQNYAIPIIEGVTNHPPMQFAMKPVEDGLWRLHEGGLKSLVSYDFAPVAGDEALLAKRHSEQVTDPDSIFRKTLVAKIRRDKAHYVLRGRKLETLWPGRSDSHLIKDPEELVSTLSEVFGLDVPYMANLWPAICERHLQMHPQAEG